MRQRKRIPIVIEKLPIRYFAKDQGVELLATPDLGQVEDYWLEHPDLRLGQVLLHLGYIHNTPGMWYYTEEVKWMIEKGLVEPREILFWGVNFTKDMERLPETEWRLIKDLNTEHIKAILEGGYVDSNPYYKRIFEDEIRKRKFAKILNAV